MDTDIDQARKEVFTWRWKLKHLRWYLGWLPIHWKCSFYRWYSPYWATDKKKGA